MQCRSFSRKSDSLFAHIYRSGDRASQQQTECPKDSIMPRVRTSYAKHWCFTINHARMDQIIFTEDLKYVIVGAEQAPTTGTYHLQGYVCFKNRIRLTGAKAHFPRAHLEIMRGTIAQAIAYCKKDGDWKEWGVIPSSAAAKVHKIWNLAYQKAIDGKIDEIPKCMLVRYYQAFKRMEQDNPKKPARLAVRQNIWIHAPSGYGKSTYAREEYPDFYDKAPNKWFVGYRNETTILCDDFGPEQCKYLGWYIKRWADLFPFPMETKGGGKMIRPERVVVTSQYSIAECFDYDELVCEAINNRFTVLNLLHWRERREIAILITDDVLEPATHSDHDRTATTESMDSQ